MQKFNVEFYKSKQIKYSERLKKISPKIKRFAWYRLIAFIIVFIPGIINGWKEWPSIVISIVALFIFFFLVKRNSLLERKKKKWTVLKKIVEDELLAQNGTYSQFDNGTEFLNPEHFNSYDLDLFGDGSIFQFLNRTATEGGKYRLAEWLQNPSNKKEDIEQRQRAIHELSVIPNWRLHLLAKGSYFKETPQINSEIQRWSDIELKLNNSKIIRLFSIVLPVITLIAAVPAVLGVSNLWLILTVFIQWIALLFFMKKVNSYYQFFGRKSKVLEKYMKLLDFIENREFKAELLVKLQEKISQPRRASYLFRQLKKDVARFEFRQNIVMNFILNSVLLWDIRCVYNLWKWHTDNRQALKEWLDVVSEIDALISLANFAYNNPAFIYPDVKDNDDFVFQAKQLGHPLINEEKRVCNDISVNGWSKVLIITGANMAGKSTFLRTIGVNFIFARMGAPVCAKKMKFSPVKIYTNMRTTDSLVKDESYFFSELKRLKMVLDELEKGEKVLVILDEVLKGTNSVDKLNGSRQLIIKILGLKAVAFIATHDLKISEMEYEFPQMVFNKCFEIKIENGEMIFDYRLKKGVTKTMNATFLMKKMGII